MLALAGLAVALIGLALLWPMHWSRKWSATIARAALLAVLAAALAGATSVRRSDLAASIVIADLSGSVTAFVAPQADAQGKSIPVEHALRSALASATAKAGTEDRFGLIVTGSSSQLLAAPRSALPTTEPLPAPAGEGTDLAAAVRLALAAAPAAGRMRVLLATDGNQTTGDVLAAAQAAARAGVAIDVLPLTYDLSAEVLIDRVETPTRAAAGSVAPVRVTLVSSGPARGTLRLYVEGSQIRINTDAASPDPGRAVSLAPGRTTIAVNAPLGVGRVHRVEASFEPEIGSDGRPVGDTIALNNRGLAVTTTPGTGAVLLVDGVGRAAADSAGRDLARVLESQGFVVRVVPPEGIPSDVLALAAFDLVILQNVSADAVPETTQQILVRHVQDFGAGLIMVGGPDSFASGGWRGSAIEPILPVTLELPDRLVVPSTAVVIVLDSSGSMNRRVLGSGRSQQEIANFGAAAAIKSLEATDLVGVIRFEANASWVVNLGPNRDPATTEKDVLGIWPDGGTNLPPALIMAREALVNVKAQVKHIVVLSDGVSQGRNQLAGLAQECARDGIKISAISVGDEADNASLERLASIGQGEFYRVIDADLLPRIFLRAVRVVRTPLVREEPFVPVISATNSPLIAGLSDAEMPALGGLTLTQPKIGADRRTVESVTYSLLSPQGEPVLSSWAVGLGQVAAFTSDASIWAKAWREQWGSYGRFWAQVARSISRPPAEQLTDLSMILESGQLRLRVEALQAEGKPIDGLTMPAAIFDPRGSRTEITLSQTGPGVYEGSLPAEDAGTYVAMVSPRAQGGGPLRPIVGGAVRPPGDEYRRLKSNDALLAEIARITGGRVLTLNSLAAMDARTLLARDTLKPTEARTPLWPWLIPLAVAALLVDIAARRIAWERLAERLPAAIAPRVNTALSAAAERRASSRPVAEPPRTEPTATLKRAIKVSSRGAEPGGPTLGGTSGGPAAAESGGTSSLAAAKRRAREKMDDR